MKGANMATGYVDPKDCPSTHGGSGYASGSFVTNDGVICGMCGTVIPNPPPTGSYADGSPKFGDAVSGQNKPTKNKSFLQRVFG